jgi:hypothetical protein
MVTFATGYNFYLRIWLIRKEVHFETITQYTIVHSLSKNQNTCLKKITLVTSELRFFFSFQTRDMLFELLLVACVGHYATSRKVAGSSPDEVEFFNLPSPSSRTMALGSTQPLTEISTRNLPGGNGRPALRAEKLTAICEPIVQKMWET